MAVPMQLALRERQPLTRALGSGAIMVVIGAAFGWLGPSGTHDLQLGERLSYWMLAMLVIGMIAGPTFWGVARLGLLRDWPWPGKALAAMLLVAIPGTLISMTLQALFGHTVPIRIGAIGQTYLTVAVVTGL